MRRILAATAALLCVGTLLARPAAQRGNNIPDNVAVRPIEPPDRPLPPEADTARVKKFSFLAYGDTRSAGSRAGEEVLDGHVVQGPHTAVVEGMIETTKRLASTDFPVRFVVSSGDAVLYGPNGTMWNVSYIPVVERLTRSAGLPFFYAPGNHDLTVRKPGDPEREHGLRNTLSAMAKLMPPNGSPRRLDGYPTFSFGYGNAFFILFDSNISADEKQLAWVKGQLEGIDRRRYRHVFAVFHHPPFDSGQYGGPTPQATSQGIRDLYLPLFRKHHVRMTICGHDHMFDYFVERYQDNGRTYRMDHLVSGGGGAPTYVYTAEPDLDAYDKQHAAEHVRVEHLNKPGTTVAENPHHFVVVRVDGDDVSLEVVAAPPAAYRPLGIERFRVTR